MDSPLLRVSRWLPRNPKWSYEHFATGWVILCRVPSFHRNSWCIFQNDDLKYQFYGSRMVHSGHEAQHNDDDSEISESNKDVLGQDKAGEPLLAERSNKLPNERLNDFNKPVTDFINLEKHDQYLQNSLHLNDRNYFGQKELKSERIHVVGMGLSGQYIAHCISRLDNPPPIILLMHRPLIMQQWHDEGAAIRIIRNDKLITQSGFHIESSANFQRTSPYQRFVGFGKNLEHTSEPPSYAIDNLIVTTTSSLTIAALKSIYHRIRPTTTICIIQNGMGIVQKLNKVFFTSKNTRPTYVLGQLSHNLVNTENYFTHIQKGPSELYCSKLPRLDSDTLEMGAYIERTDFSWSPEARHLVGTLARIPELNTITLGHKDFHKKKLSDLVISAVIESLAVAFDCANGELLYNYSISNIMKRMIQEISLIITSLPELRNIKYIQKEFNPEFLQSKIISNLQRTEVTVSPMLANLRAKQRTEIDYYTGYFVDRANELDIACPFNEMIYNLVKGKQTNQRRAINKCIPFVQARERS